MGEGKRSIAIAYSMKKKKSKELPTSREKGVINRAYPKDSDLSGGTSVAGHDLQMGYEGNGKEHHKRALKELKEDNQDRKNLASGGSVESGDPTMNYADGGAVGCPHCKPCMSHGGQVANELGEGASADELPNEFDDLVLRDDLAENYTGSNSGDEIGNEGEKKRRSDVVMRAMAKRKEKKNG